MPAPRHAELLDLRVAYHPARFVAGSPARPTRGAVCGADETMPNCAPGGRGPPGAGDPTWNARWTASPTATHLEVHRNTRTVRRFRLQRTYRKPATLVLLFRCRRGNCQLPRSRPRSGRFQPAGAVAATCSGHHRAPSADRCPAPSFPAMERARRRGRLRQHLVLPGEPGAFTHGDTRDVMRSTWYGKLQYGHYAGPNGFYEVRLQGRRLIHQLGHGELPGRQARAPSTGASMPTATTTPPTPSPSASPWATRRPIPSRRSPRTCSAWRASPAAPPWRNRTLPLLRAGPGLQHPVEDGEGSREIHLSGRIPPFLGVRASRTGATIPGRTV